VGDLDAALRRLNGALEAAEAAVGRAIDAADASRAREEELTAFADDRQRLAELLDVSAAQAETSEATRAEVARRLDAAIAQVKGVLEEAGG
jgi:L-lactate utilization protein LutB